MLTLAGTYLQAFGGGGLTGTIMSVKDEVVVLRLPPDNIKLEVARSSIVTLTTQEESKS